MNEAVKAALIRLILTQESPKCSWNEHSATFVCLQLAETGVWCTDSRHPLISSNTYFFGPAELGSSYIEVAGYRLRYNSYIEVAGYRLRYNPSKELDI